MDDIPNNNWFEEECVKRTAQSTFCQPNDIMDAMQFSMQAQMGIPNDFGDSCATVQMKAYKLKQLKRELYELELKNAIKKSSKDRRLIRDDIKRYKQKNQIPLKGDIDYKGPKTFHEELDDEITEWLKDVLKI